MNDDIIYYFESILLYGADMLGQAKSLAYSLYQYQMPTMKKENPNSFSIDPISMNMTEDDNNFGLDFTIRNQLESAFGIDLSDVRIHTGTAANYLTSYHKAEAVTIGSHIYFADGKYSSQTEEGITLLAHEITHVIDSKHLRGTIAQEDRANLEMRAEKVEEEISGMRLHNIKSPVFNDDSETDSFKVSSTERNKDAFMKTIVGSGGDEALDSFHSRDRTPSYRISLRDGSTVSVNPPEYHAIVHECAEKIKELIVDASVSQTNEEYEKMLLRYTQWLDRGLV